MNLNSEKCVLGDLHTIKAGIEAHVDTLRYCAIGRDYWNFAAIYPIGRCTITTVHEFNSLREFTDYETSTRLDLISVWTDPPPAGILTARAQVSDTL